MTLISKPINLSTEANLLYEIYKTLKKINIASGSSGSQNLAQTLLIDNKTNDIPIVSNDGNSYGYIIDEHIQIGNETSGIKRLTMEEDNYAFLSNVRFTFDGKGIDMNTSSDGLGIPRVTTTQMNAIAFPTDGMLVWNTTEGKIYQFNGTVWEPLSNPPQTLAQTLAEDNKTNDIPIVSNNEMATVDVNDAYTSLGYDTQAFVMTNAVIKLYSYVPVVFDSTVSTDFNTPVLNYNGAEVATVDQLTALSSLETIPTDTFVTLGLGRELTENYYDTSNVGTGGLFLDKTIIFPENSTIPFQAGYVEDSVTPTPVTLLPYRFTTDAYVFYQGARVTDITIQPEDVCTLKWDGNNSTDGIQIWFLSIVSKNASLMLQFTQSGTSGPSIVTGSASGLRGASITSTSRVSDGDFRIVFSLPILADALDCYKNSATIPLNLIGDFGSSIINGWQFSIIDDYTVRVVSISDFFNTGAPSDSVVGEPTLLEIKFKN